MYQRKKTITLLHSVYSNVIENLGQNVPEARKMIVSPCVSEADHSRKQGETRGGDGACSETNDKETAGSRLEIQLLKQGCAKNPGQGLGSSGPQESPRIHQPLLRVLSTEIEGHLLSITGPPALLREASNSTNLDLQLRAKAGPRPTQQGERMPT